MNEKFLLEIDFYFPGDLGKAVGTLVATMTHEGESDLPSDEEGDSTASDTEEDKAV